MEKGNAQGEAHANWTGPERINNPVTKPSREETLTKIHRNLQTMESKSIGTCKQWRTIKSKSNQERKEQRRKGTHDYWRCDGWNAVAKGKGAIPRDAGDAREGVWQSSCLPLHTSTYQKTRSHRRKSRWEWGLPGGGRDRSERGPLVSDHGELLRRRGLNRSASARRGAACDGRPRGAPTEIVRRRKRKHS